MTGERISHNSGGIASSARLHRYPFKMRRRLNEMSDTADQLKYLRGISSICRL